MMDSRFFPPGIFLSHHDTVRPTDWREQFGCVAPIQLEIGFGQGEFLLRQAQGEPGTHFIGIEQDWSRIYKCLESIAHRRMNSGESGFARNVRLMRVDATVALQRIFKPESLAKVISLFPCPWPKKSHVKHRLFSRQFLILLNSRMQMGAEFQLVTDWKPYFDWVVQEMAGTGFEAQEQLVEAKFNTKFERKWQSQGQKEFWQLRLLKKEARLCPVLEDECMQAYFMNNFDPQNFQVKNLVGETSIIFKDFLFDNVSQKGLVRLVVAEKFLTQHVWVAIVKSPERWVVAKADGHSALPSSAVAHAIRWVWEAAIASATQGNCHA